MAGELHYWGDPATESGLTLTAKVYSTGSAPAQVGSDVTFTETGSTAIYTGNMPSTAAGVYVVRYFSAGSLLRQSEIVWDGSAESTFLNACPSASTIATAVFTQAMTEAYPVKGAAITLAQGIYNINQQLGEQTIVGTTMTIKKRNQTTTAKTFTLDSATTPTAISENT